LTKKKQDKSLPHSKIKEPLQDLVKRYREMFPEHATEPNKQCMNCRKTKALTQYFKTRNPLITNRRIGICKVCIEEKIDFSDFGEAQYFLALMHLPFVEEAWNNVLEQSNPISQYLKAMNLGQYSNLDPIAAHTMKTYGKAYHNDPYQEQVQSLQEEEKGYLQAKWGNHYDLIDCLKLEEYAQQMKEDYHVETRSHEDYLQKIAKTSLIIDEMMKEANYKGVKEMSKTLDDLMKSAGFTQSSKSKEEKQSDEFNAFGYVFEMAEKQGFIPQYHNEEDPDIVDKTIVNLKEWTENLVKGESDLDILMENALESIVRQETEAQNVEDKKHEDY